MQYFLLILGLALVVKSADILIDSASKIAKRFGVSAFVIGITVVAFGTSAPELAVGIISGVSKNNQLTLGNIIGSGVSNIAWIIGITAIIMPLTVKKSVIKREIPILLGIEAVLALMLFFNGLLSRINGIMLIAGFISFMIYIIISSKKTAKLPLQQQTVNIQEAIANGNIVEQTTSTQEQVAGEALAQNIICESIDTEQNEIYENTVIAEEKQISDTVKPEKPTGKRQLIKLWIFAVISLAGLFIGGKLTVDSSSKIAESFGLSETLIGLTVVAFATTLPELVASIMAVIKKEPEIILGNCIGSNIFNILLVLGTSAVISPITVNNALWLDMAVFAALTAFILIISLVRKSIRRSAGIILLLSYISYITYNILAVTVF